MSDSPRDPTSTPIGDGMYAAPGWRPGQVIMNAHWPPHPEVVERHERGIPVTARVVWVSDGEEYVKGTATRWDDARFYVEFDDRRLEASGVWLKKIDVYLSEPVPRERQRPPRLKRVEDAMRRAEPSPGQGQ